VSDAARVRASASERNEQRRRLSEDVPFKTRYCVILNRYCKKIGIVKRQSTIPLFFSHGIYSCSYQLMLMQGTEEEEGDRAAEGPGWPHKKLRSQSALLCRCLRRNQCQVRQYHLQVIRSGTSMLLNTCFFPI
jgi:hypothetical protein